jgi:hypothetical protein
LPTVAAQRPELSTETGRRREDTLRPAVRAASARALSATSRRADRQRAIRHAEAPAWVADLVAAVVADHVEAAAVAADLVAAVAGVISQSSVMFLVACKIRKWREAICGERT